MLKIAIQSMLDLLLHQSHTSGHASFSLCGVSSKYLCHQPTASGKESRCRCTERPMKEEMKSLARPLLLLLYHTKSQADASVADRQWPNLHELNTEARGGREEERARICSLPGNGERWKGRCEIADRDLAVHILRKKEKARGSYHSPSDKKSCNQNAIC